MKIGVCGIAYGKCPRMINNECPSGDVGCTPKENKFCKIALALSERELNCALSAKSFPCETTKAGPISYGYCQFMSGKSE